MQELYESVYKSRPPVIDGLLYSGTYLFAGAPKVGKSFFMAQLAYHISTGQKLWDYEVHQGTVLYLALEDDYQRLQEHPDTRLIIIDTLQKVRELGGEAYSYADDYQIVGRLKQFSDKHGVCMMVVHHTRKTSAGDKFEMISGTTGLLGCADGAFVLRKEKRTDNTAVLDVVGRDQPDQSIYLTKDEERLLWCFDHADRELWKEKPDALLEAISKILTKDNPMWQGSASDLISALGAEMQPNTLTKRLNVRAGKLLNDYGIGYENTHGRNGSRITLKLAEPVM